MNEEEKKFENQEFDVVRSLELTAEDNYNEGYAVGLAAGEAARRELVEAAKGIIAMMPKFVDKKTLLAFCVLDEAISDAILLKHEKEDGE